MRPERDAELEHEVYENESFRGQDLSGLRTTGCTFRGCDFTLAQVYSADEAFVTGTFAGVVPVHTVDGRTIGSGRRGPMVSRLQELYADLVRRDVAARP